MKNEVVGQSAAIEKAVTEIEYIPSGDACLAKFCYRFKRQFDLQTMIRRFVITAANTPVMPERLLELAVAYGYQESS